MIFYLLGLLSYYKLANKPVPWTICLAFFAVVTIPPGTTLMFLVNKHWIFQALAFAGGLFCWTFFEYCIHRFWMHNKHNKHYHNSEHFTHHVNPTKISTGNFKRSLITGAAVVMICLSILFSNYLFLPAGMFTGFAIYGYMHLWLHQPQASKWLGGLQRFHMMHHLGQTEKCFGVTFTWWDRVFNTAGKAEKNTTAKTIGLYFGNKQVQNLTTQKQAI